MGNRMGKVVGGKVRNMVWGIGRVLGNVVGGIVRGGVVKRRRIACRRGW